MVQILRPVHLRKVQGTFILRQSGLLWLESNKEVEIIESYIEYLEEIETGIVIDDFDIKMFKNISSYLKGVIK